MAEPWFDPGLFAALYGGIVGGVGGSVIGLAGGAGGDLARKGQQRLWVRAVLIATSVVGVVSVVVAVVAFTVGQPAGIWGWLAGIGLLLSVLSVKVSRALKQLHEQAIK